MNRNEIWRLIEIGLKKDKKENPNWPEHPAGQAGMVCKKSGKLLQSCMEWKYDRDMNNEVVKSAQHDRMPEDAISTIVASFRFLENLKEENE